MKRILLAISLVLTLCGTSAFAQSSDAWTDRKNEFNFSVSGLSIPTIAETFGAVLGTAFSLGNFTYDNLTIIGTFNAEYYRKLNKTFAVGGGLSYEHWMGDIMKKQNDVMVKDGRHNSDFLSLMVGAKAFWFERGHASMYSKVIGGATGYTNESSPVGATYAFQVSPVAVSFGGDAWRGFVELGFGTQGIGIIGFSRRF